MSIRSIREREKSQKQQQLGQKILYVLGRFPTLSETFVQQEILELERQGLQVRIFSLFKPINSKEAEVIWSGQASVTCISLCSILVLLMYAIRYFFKSPIRFLRAFITILAQYRWEFLIGCRVILFSTFIATKIEGDNIAHIHAHFASESTSVAQCTHVLTRIPYSFTAHANDIYLSSTRALAYKIKMAHFVITISIYNLRYLRAIVDQNITERIHCVYNGLNLLDFPTNSSDAAYLPQTPLILSVCRLVEKKGIAYLLHACHILADQGYEFICHIVGDGPLRQQLEQTINELGLSNQVKLLGAKTHRQVIEMYPKATIMALPCIISKNGDRDGLPTVLIESLYLGIPSVSTTVSAIPELISSEINGLLVPPNDSIALATAMARLLDDPSLRFRLANAGHQTVVERFDLARNVKHIVSLFQVDSGE